MLTSSPIGELSFRCELIKFGRLINLEPWNHSASIKTHESRITAVAYGWQGDILWQIFNKLASISTGVLHIYRGHLVKHIDKSRYMAWWLSLHCSMALCVLQCRFSINNSSLFQFWWCRNSGACSEYDFKQNETENLRVYLKNS